MLEDRSSMLPRRPRCVGRFLALLAVAVAAAVAIAVASASVTANKPYRVAILSIGTPNDRSFAQANFEGGELARKRYGAEVTLVPNVISPDQYLQQGAAFAKKGYDMVIFAYGAVTEVSKKLAKQFPKTIFTVYDHPFGKAAAALPPNDISMDPAQQEGSFLAGALAGLVTKTNTVGGLSGVPFPLVTRQLEAFNLGARCVNPDVKVLQGYTNDYADVATSRTAAQGMMGQGADILFAVLNGATRGLYSAARTKPNTYVIAQYFNQSSQAPDVILTSVLYNFQGLIADVIHKGMTGKMPPRAVLVYNLKNMNVGTLAGFGKLKSVVGAANLKKLEQIRRAIVAGKIRVPDVRVIGKPGSASKINVKSLGCA